MEFLLQLEIIIWLVLTLLLVVTPLMRLTNRYLPEIKKMIAHIKEIELPNTNTFLEAGKKIQQAASLAPWRNDVSLNNENIENKEHVTKVNQEEQKTPKILEKEVITENEKHESPNIAINKETITEEVIKDIQRDTWTASEIEKNEDNLVPESAYTSDISINDTTNKEIHKELPDEQIKKNKKLETIKYAALASKERGKITQYEKKLVEWLALDPWNITFLSLLSSHYFDSNQEIKALTLLKKVVNKEPTNHKAIWQIGQIYTSQKQFETAQLLIEKAIALKDDHPKYYISLVEIRYETWDIQKAIQTMEKLLKLRPTNTDYLLTMATLFEEDKKPTLATKYYSKVLEIDPSNNHAKKWMKKN